MGSARSGQFYGNLVFVLHLRRAGIDGRSAIFVPSLSLVARLLRSGMSSLSSPCRQAFKQPSYAFQTLFLTIRVFMSLVLPLSPFLLSFSTPVFLYLSLFLGSKVGLLDYGWTYLRQEIWPHVLLVVGAAGWLLCLRCSGELVTHRVRLFGPFQASRLYLFGVGGKASNLTNTRMIYCAQLPAFYSLISTHFSCMFWAHKRWISIRKTSVGLGSNR